MSGIVGIINLDGAPVDRDLLKRMTDFMTFRGPDAQEIWIDGNVGFGHTMLRTTWEAETETQPLTLDGKVWLTADARIDDRKELIAELESKLRTKLQIPHLPNGDGSESRVPNDAELILFAYQAWGEDCVKHLIGDFAFAIWDGRERRLFCGRDQLGVKPFYYARVGNSFLFSNTLNCLRLHHAVSNKLNDLAVADFLLFGFNQDKATTTFADIQRVPPAHWIGGSVEAIRLRRYWTLPINEQRWQMSETESIDRFRSLLSDAVEDRLRTDRVAVSLSGGLDSSTVAATARELWAKKNRPLDLKGFTMVYDQLLPDEERHYSGLVAERLGIPIQYLVVDNYRLFDRINQLHRPEPSDFPLPALVFDYLNQVTDHSRVLLSGDGGDPLMFYSWKDLARSLRRFRVLRVLRYIPWHLWTYRQLPRLGYRETWKYWTGRQSDWRYSYPSWLSQSLTERLDLQARLEVVNELPVSIHSERPEAYNNFLRSS